MDIRLIAMDLDGTALQADRKTFSPRLNAARQKGAAVVPITGRQFFILPPAVHKDVEWAGLVVLSSGGGVRRLTDGELLSAHYMETDALYALIDMADRMSLPVEVSALGGLYLTRKSWELLLRAAEGQRWFHLDTVLEGFGHVADDLRAFCRTTTEVDKANLPYIPDEAREETERALNALPLSWFWSGPRSIEIAHPDTFKANGLLEACRLLDIDPAHAMALGDSGNDIPMLQAAGLGVAMGTASPQVQAAANAVSAPFDQDGAALAVERYVLG